MGGETQEPARSGASSIIQAPQSAAEALRASEDRFRAIFNQAAVGIAVAGLDSRFLQANRRICEILGYSNDELTSRTFSDITHPDDVPATLERVRQLLSGNIQEYVLEKRYQHKAGAIVWCLTSVTLLRDTQGRPVYFIGIVEDISERKQTELALRQTAQRLQLALAAGQLGDWTWDATTDLVNLGARAAEIFGLPAGVPISWARMRDLLVEEDAERARLAVEHSLESRTVYDIEYRVDRPNGGRRWIAARGNGIYDSDGKVLGMVGVLQDVTERKEAEASRARLAAVVESSDDAIVSKTLEGIITSWNTGAERIFGYTAREAIGQPITMLIPQERLAEEPAILARIAAGERIDHYESVRVRKDGRRIDVSLSVSPVKDHNGRIVGASKIARDISLQKRAETALREETRTLEILNKSGTAIAAQLDLHTLVQAVTDAATELVGAKFGSFFYTVRDERGDAFMLYTLSGAPREAFAKFGHPRATPVFAPTFRGEPVIRSDDILQDPRYGKWAPHHGQPAGHLPVRSYLAIPVVARSGDVIGGLFFGHPEPGMFDERSERLLIAFAAQAAIAIDNARLYEAAQREIERREEAEQALRETDRRKDEFLATLAHELRNPLAPIRQAALIAQATAASDAQKRWSHEVITRQVQHMSLLLDDLLDVSRITRGTLELRKKRTELASIIDAAVETARPVIDSKRHHLEITVPPERIHFEADPLRIAQVLSNLLTNAAKYTDPEGHIRLRARRDDDTIEIAVADTGIGLSADSLPDVFRMFSQVKSHQDRSDGGLGIGLALARGLVTLHGGTIEAHSKGLGHGSEFIVRLPIGAALEPGSEAPPAGDAVPSAAGHRVLVADDNRDAAESLAMLLRMDGHEVRVATDGTEAVALFARMQPDFAILDIGMPGLNGYEVARRMRKDAKGRPLRLIAVTGWGQQTDKALAFAAGFDHHFTKPLEPDKLLDLLRS
jgi:PAS domain S-box-containing protein